LPSIVVCILTYKRPDWLNRLLTALENQKTSGQFVYSVRVVDNDPGQGAKSAVLARNNGEKIRFDYDFEPKNNLALARNRAALGATGDYIAYIDDDEFPVEDWLWQLWNACQKYGADGVLGPVRPHFESPPPKWIEGSGVCERPILPTGLVLNYDQTRTGNVLLKRSLFDPPGNRFDDQFVMHGEDRDFFKRLIAQGHKFIWCEEAVVHETQAARRCGRVYHIRRALLRGSISWRHAPAKLPLLLKTVAALGLYTASLPFLLLAGQGWFMKYFVKDCDHLGRLLAAFGFRVERYIATP
jgi:GT2 family glycosyltransferase